MIDPRLYFYRAFVTGIYDGDTMKLTIDLGFHSKIDDQKVRRALKEKSI